MTLEDAGEDQIAPRPGRIEALVARLLASRNVLSLAPRILPCRHAAVCRLSGKSSTAVAAQNGSYSYWS